MRIGIAVAAAGTAGVLWLASISHSVRGAEPAQGYSMLAAGEARGINSQGDIVGNSERGMYVVRKGKYEYFSVMLPSASPPMRAMGINPRGDIVGHYFNATDPPVYSPLSGVHGFLLTKRGYAGIDVPGAWGTVATGINPSGDVVGFYFQGGQNGAFGTTHGFLLRGGVFTSIDVPGSTSTLVWGINSLGNMVGTYFGGLGQRGFVLHEGRYSDILFNSGGGATDPKWATEVTGINEDGDIVGYSFIARTGLTYGYVLSGADYAIGANKAQALHLPGVASGASPLIPYGINSPGDIVGTLLTGNTWTGFLRRERD